MIYYLFLAWDNKVVIRAGAFIFCVGNQLSRLSERREGKALTQDSEVGVWAGALFLFLRTGSRVRRLTLGKNFFLKVRRRTREPVLKQRMRASAQIPTSLS